MTGDTLMNATATDNTDRAVADRPARRPAAATVFMPGKDNPRARPSTPAEIVAAAHAAAPLVWRKRVGFFRRSESAQAVRGALNLMRLRVVNAIRRRNCRPVFSADESELLRAAERQYRNMVWVHFFFRPDDAARRARAKADTLRALSIIDQLVNAEISATETAAAAQVDGAPVIDRKPPPEIPTCDTPPPPQPPPS